MADSPSDQNILKLEYGYGTNTQNNGSLRSQKITFGGLSQAYQQTYTYDDLNRLTSAEEKVGTTTNWKQTFIFDRYGNRTFDPANTTTLGVSNNVTNPAADTTTNRLNGQTYVAAGNLTVDAENHQTKLFLPTNNSVTPDAVYQYDGEGRRVRKISCQYILRGRFHDNALSSPFSTMPRIAAGRSIQMLHVALFEPEIPPNTGNVARLCGATFTDLHIVGVTGFRMDDRTLKRAGLDYWEEVRLHRHIDFERLYAALPESRFVYIETSGERCYADFEFRAGDCLVFGRETRGLPAAILDANRDNCLSIPMPNANVRSLNLANSVAIVLYEALRQIGRP